MSVALKPSLEVAGEASIVNISSVHAGATSSGVTA
jgi:hypothetical protein